MAKFCHRNIVKKNYIVNGKACMFPNWGGGFVTRGSSML